MAGDIVVRPMTASDLAEVTHVYRLAFGTFLKVPDPTRFRLDIGTVSTRFASDPGAALVAQRNGHILGSAFGMDWGSQFVVGPITVDPAHWGQGVARQLSAAILDVAAARKPGLISLFTHPASTTHLRLYESLGFVSMYLTPIMSKPLGKVAPLTTARFFSMLAPAEQTAALAQARALTDASFSRLDLGREIGAIQAQHLGETILLDGTEGLAGIALCHIGAGTEAGEDALFVKFAAVRPEAAADFEQMLDAIEVLGVARRRADNGGRQHRTTRCLSARARPWLLRRARRRRDAPPRHGRDAAAGYLHHRRLALSLRAPART